MVHYCYSCDLYYSDMKDRCPKCGEEYRGSRNLRYCSHCDAYTIDDGNACSVCGQLKFGLPNFERDSDRIQERRQSFMFPLKIRTEDKEIKLYDTRYRGDKYYVKFVEPNGDVEYDIMDEYTLEEGIGSPVSLPMGRIGKGKFRYRDYEPADVFYTKDHRRIINLNRRRSRC